MKIKPLYDRVLVKRLDPKEQVRGGIFIPDSAKEKPMEGEIVAVGDGKVADDGTRVALTVKAGDIVLIGKYAGTEVKGSDDIEYIIMREDEILGIVEN